MGKNIHIAAAKQNVITPSGAAFLRVSFPKVWDAALYFVDRSDYVDPLTQTLTASTPNGLPGIPLGATIPDIIKNSPVHMAGVWWNEEKQQYYLSDTKDSACGKYVQRLIRIRLTSDMSWNVNIAGTWIYTILSGVLSAVGSPVMCNYAVCGSWDKSESGKVCLGNGGTMVLCFCIYDFSTVGDFKNWLDDKGDVDVIVPLAIPIETPLTEEELAQYAALHTNKPNTTIYNDAGAGLKLGYIADTKAYIDNKFTELQNAILSAGANI